MRLLPRDVKFYDLFLQHAQITLNAASILVEATSSGDSSLVTAAGKIRLLEQEGDSIIHEIYVRLNQTFITPLDPEDIHSLSSHLDNVLDGLEDAAHRIVAYQVHPIPEMVIELCRIVHSCAVSVKQAMEALRDGKPVLEHCIEINRLEEVADNIGREVVSGLFKNEKDPITLLKLKEVYDFLEQTVDNCEDVANVLQNIVVKNA
jgi:predicted phosphate transport protein (TIGR00153 family)